MLASAAAALPCPSRSRARPGCGSQPLLGRFAEGAFGGREVAAQAQELALLVRRLRHRRAVRHRGEAPPCPPRFLERRLPVALELHDLRPVREAAVR